MSIGENKIQESSVKKPFERERELCFFVIVILKSLVEWSLDRDLGTIIRFK